jgi:hypothetical protein
MQSFRYGVMAAGVEEGQTIHLVQGAPATAPSVVHQGGSPMAGQSPTSAPGLGGMGNMQNMQQQMMNNPDMMRSMMNSPMMQSIMNNPEIMRSLIQSNPQMQAIIEQNPEIGHVLNDPAVLRQTLEAARSPELMREMMRTSDRAMSNIESHPEGFNMLRRMYHTVQEPLMDAAIPGSRATNGDATSSMPTVDPSNPFADLFQASSSSHDPATPLLLRCCEPIVSPRVPNDLRMCSPPRLLRRLRRAAAPLPTLGRQQHRALRPPVPRQGRPDPAPAPHLLVLVDLAGWAGWAEWAEWADSGEWVAWAAWAAWAA